MFDGRQYFARENAACHREFLETIEALTRGRNLNLIVLAWLVAAVIRIAQGSATVAMLI